jgi:uncharacterized protein YjbJ (UPF0337 family)
LRGANQPPLTHRATNLKRRIHCRKNEQSQWNQIRRWALCFHLQLPEEIIMDKEHVKGAADKAKGAIKDAAGKVMGDSKLQAEGKLDKAKGAAHEALGDVKDALKRPRRDSDI